MKMSKIETMAWLDNLPPYTVIRQKGDPRFVYCKQEDEYNSNPGEHYEWYLADAWEGSISVAELARFEWEVLVAQVTLTSTTN